MNNIKIAKQLIKIAKDMVSFVSEQETIDNDINVFSDMRTYNNMKFPGRFIIISCPFSKIVKFKDDIKKLGFTFDPSTKEWHVFHKKLSDNGANFNSVVQLIKNKMGVGGASSPQPANNPASQPTNTTKSETSDIKLDFGYIQFEKFNLCFIVKVNDLCESSVGDFIKNLNTFCSQCNNIVKVLKEKFAGTAFSDMHFNGGADEYEMHGDEEIFNNLYVLSKNKNIFDEIENFLKQNNIKIKNP